MEAKRINISILLRVGFKKTKISKQLNASRVTVYRLEQRLKEIVLDQEDLRL